MSKFVGINGSTIKKEGYQMGNYKIVVKVDIVECNEPGVNEFGKRKDGGFEMKISKGEGISIDRCDKALLKTDYEAGAYKICG